MLARSGLLFGRLFGRLLGCLLGRRLFGQLLGGRFQRSPLQGFVLPAVSSSWGLSSPLGLQVHERPLVQVDNKVNEAI